MIKETMVKTIAVFFLDVIDISNNTMIFVSILKNVQHNVFVYPLYF